MKSLHKAALAASGVALAAAAALAPSTASAVPVDETGSSTMTCQWVHQYRVTDWGDMTDAEWGGNRIGDAIPGDTFNVRYQGNPRYWGANVNNGRWGWILTSKLSYTGNSWCA